MWGVRAGLGRARARYLHTVTSSKSRVNNVQATCPAVLTQSRQTKEALPTTYFILNFSPRTINLEIGEQNQNITKITDFPIHKMPITNPISIIPLIDDIVGRLDFNLPPITTEEVQAARLLVIRRKKMKKHKLRKLRKRMKYTWARVKQRRRQRKEKMFRAELMAMVKESEQFSAEKYVSDKLAEANHTSLPRFWKGKRLPQFIIRQLLGIDKKINYKHTEHYKA